MIKTPTKRQLIKDYKELGSLTRIARKYHVSITTVQNWFKKKGIKTEEQKLKELHRKRWREKFGDDS